MTKHNYAEALKSLPFQAMLDPRVAAQYGTIRHALKLADKIMGEMSDEMAELIAKECRCCGGMAESLYRAMRDQALKEIV